MFGCKRLELIFKRHLFRRECQAMRQAIPVKDIQATKIPGFFPEDECRQLYQLTMSTQGPILEIGHFLGRSTACICEALADSQKKREFFSYDLGFKTPGEFKTFYDRIHRMDVAVPDLYNNLVFSKKTTTTEIARSNLKELGMDAYVNLISGNFIELDKRKYAFIFCDALHEPNEIRLNLPHIMQRSGQNCIWAFHDMNDENIGVVSRLSNAVLVDRLGSLATFLSS